MNARLVTFLSAHHLTSGIGGYWDSSVVTVGSDGAVTIRAVQCPHACSRTCGRPRVPGTTPARTARTSWSPSSAPGFFNHWQPNRAALAALGRPTRIYHVGPYTVYVYNKNLLARPTGTT